MTPLEELGTILRPAGGGLYLVSTGRDAQLALQRKLYSAANDADVDVKWREALARIATAKICILGIPSDVGAGFRRGANLGPQGIRQTLLAEMPDFPDYAAKNGIIDIGDVFTVPQLLSDDMLDGAQLARTRKALYPDVADAERAKLPASPLSIAERAWQLVFQLNPKAKPFTLGGDHSCAWPATAALARRGGEPLGIVQIDAHTDLLKERLGIHMCFATWSYHANELLGRGGRLTQVGIRATRHERGHWENTLGVRQFWAEECLRDPNGALDAIIAHVKSSGVRAVYFSNDIDGTDASWADATGTPEPGGLTPDFVARLIERLGREVDVVAGDVMEVAPPLQDKPDSAARTLALAVRYTRTTLEAMLVT